MRIKGGERICEKDCPNRHAECHGSCEKYLAFHRTRRAENEENVRRKEISYFCNDSVRRTQAGYYNRVNHYRPKRP